MAVAEDIRLDLEQVADDPLDRKAPTIELGLDRLDRHPIGSEPLQRRLGLFRVDLGHLSSELLSHEEPRLQGCQRQRLARNELLAADQIGERPEAPVARPQHWTSRRQR